MPLTRWGRTKHLIKTMLRLDDLELLHALPFFTHRIRMCPICNGRGLREGRNRFTPLDRCEVCGHVFARRVPGEYLLRQIYRGFEYWKCDKQHQGIEGVEYGPGWEAYLKARMNIIRRSELLPEDSASTIFEIGASEGMLLKELEKHGHIASGCELNPVIAQEGIDKLGVKIIVGAIEAIPLEANSVDAVLSFHTLEHLRDPRQVLSKIVHMLKPKGGLLVEVPVGPEEYENTDHLQFFSENSLRVLFDEFFHESELIENKYTTIHNVEIASLYGIGRYPKQR